jgi:uncharacterized protein Usg
VTAYELQVRGYRLTTAEIIYRLPDHPALLQSFIWQKFDLAPDFPELNKFLEFWRNNIEGKLHSVNVKQSIPKRCTETVCQPSAEHQGQICAPW